MKKKSWRLWTSLILLAVVFTGALVLLNVTLSRAGEIIIDDFSVNDLPPLKLEPGDVGVTLASSVTHSNLFGGERSITHTLIQSATIGDAYTAVADDLFILAQDPGFESAATIQWDGTDGNISLDPTGLGGIDLTDNGTLDALVIGVQTLDLDISLVFRIYTDASNASEYTLLLLGGIDLGDPIVEFMAPMDLFTPFLGNGADFTDIGAITLYMRGASTDMQVEYLETVAQMAATKTDALAIDVNGDGYVNPGDTLTYTIVITDIGDLTGNNSTNIVFSDTLGANITLDAGSVSVDAAPPFTVTRGNVPGDTTVEVKIDNIADTNVATITFRATIDNPLPNCGITVSNQALINSDTMVNLVTDDPDDLTINNSTDTLVQCLSDFGDAPDSYSTLLTSNGARHLIAENVYLGAGVDDELTGRPNAGATGDDSAGVPDDEDGVLLPPELYTGLTTSTTVTASAPCNLSAWIDFDRNDNWNAASDAIFTSRAIGAGPTTLTFTVPASATAGTTYARFRCTTDSGPTLYSGEASNGEVEDYETQIVPLYTLGDFVWYDTDQDGIQDGTEPGVQGINVALFNNADCTGGQPPVTDTTGAAGDYEFIDLLSGDYCLQFSSIPAGWTISPQEVGTGAEATDSDADPTTKRITNIDLTADDPDEDVGLYIEGSIGDTVWCDTDGNDAYDATEGVAGVTVDLYLDTGCDGSPDAQILSTQDTTGDGQYLFTSLFVGPLGGPPVCYYADVEEADMGACNNPITPITYSVSLDANNPDDPDVDFGFNQLYTLGNFVWYDTNQDGIQDGSEPGVRNVDVALYDNGTCTPPFIASDTTGAAGDYGFGNLLPDTYCLEFSNIPAGWTISPQGQGGDGAVDSDADPSTGQITSIDLTANDPDEDMGIYAEGSIGDTVWCDVDGDNTYDVGEGVAGVTVDLYLDTDCDANPDGLLFTTQDTAGDGQYIFDSLPVGPPNGPPVCYYAEVDVVDMGDCDNPFTLIAYSVSLEANNPDDLTVDFGFNQLFTLGDFVWYDTDQDGIQDGSEPGVRNVGVALYDNGTCTPPFIASDTTGAVGDYGFGNLSPDTYCLEFFNIPAGWTISPQGQGGDGAVDSDADPTTERIANIDLIADDPDEDMGIYAEGSIGDTVWCDVDGDNTYDVGEGVAGVTVDLYLDTDCDANPDGLLFTTQDTAGDGQYIFDPLPVGPPNGPPVCYYAEVDVVDMGDCDNPFTLIAYSVSLEANNPDDLTVDFGFSQLLTLGDYVWYDTNQDGIQDGSEPGVQNVDVTLYDNGTCTPPFIASDTTGAAGDYGFGNLSPDTYCLEFSNIPAGWTISPQGQGGDGAVDSDADPATGQITDINLTAHDPNEDMGLYAEGFIGDTVWCDDDDAGGDDTYDVGEGVAGVTVDLYLDTDCDTNPDGLLFDTQDTANDGQYIFDPLPVGPPGGPPVCYYVEVDVADMGACDNAFTPIMYSVPLEVNNPGDLTVDFGFNQQQLASIGNYVWRDDDRDGTQNEAGTGIAGVAVDLYDCNDLYIDGTSTDASGYYNFVDLSPGDYYISFTLLSNYIFTTRGAGGDDAADSDADFITGKTICTTLTPGENDLTWDAGMFLIGPGIQIVKEVSANSWIAINTPSVVYTLTVTNIGDVSLNPVRIVDTLDPGLTFIPGSAIPPETSVVGQQIFWADITGGAGLAPAQDTQVTFEVAGPSLPGYYDNFALAEGVPPPGGVVTDNASVSLLVDSPSVSINKSLGTPAMEGDIVTFIIAIENTGPSIIDVLPLYDVFIGPMIYLDGTPLADNVDNTNQVLQWNDLTTYFGDMAPGQVFYVDTVFRLTNVTSYTVINTAEIPPGGIDIYTNPINEPWSNTAVELIDFQANQQGQAVLLSWETTAEIDTYGFRILRDRAGQFATAAEIAFIPSQAHGNASGANYEYLDDVVAAGQTYIYWLMDVDVNGIETPNGPAKITISGSLSIYLPIVFR